MNELYNASRALAFVSSPAFDLAGVEREAA